MKTTPVTAAELSGTLMSVPPLARNLDLSLNEAANRRLLAHLEAAGITNHLYGGNANFYGLSLRQYEEALDMLADVGGEASWIIPSIGPDYGKITDQTAIAKETRFPTCITLPRPLARRRRASIRRSANWSRSWAGRSSSTSRPRPTWRQP